MASPSAGVPESVPASSYTVNSPSLPGFTPFNPNAVKTVPYENPLDALAREKANELLTPPAKPSSTEQKPITNARLLTKEEDKQLFGEKPVQLQDFNPSEYVAPEEPKESPGDWSNIGGLATHVLTRAITEPLAGIGNIFRNGYSGATPLYKEVNDYNDNGTLIGTHSELTDYGKQVDNGKISDPLSSFVIGLDSYNNVTSELDRKNQLPHTFLGNTVSGALHIAPDIAMVALLPEGELAAESPSIAEGIGAMEGNTALRQVSAVNKLRTAVWNPFTKVMATKGFLKGYDEGEQKGKGEIGSMAEALKGGGEEAINAGIMGLLGGVSGEYIAPKIYKSLIENGIVKGGKITQLGVNALSDASVFGAFPILSNLAQGKPVNLDEIESGAGMGVVFGGWRGLKNFEGWDKADEQLKNVWADRFTMATQNFMNASPNAIGDVMKYGATDSDLFAKATEFAARAKTEMDPKKKIQYAGMASTLAKMSDIKGTVDAIVHDPEGFKENISKSELPEEQKSALLQKVDEISTQYSKRKGNVEPKKIAESESPAKAENNGPVQPTPPAPQPPQPTANSMLDDLDNELDQFKTSQPAETKPAESVIKPAEIVQKTPESDNSLSDLKKAKTREEFQDVLRKVTGTEPGDSGKYDLLPTAKKLGMDGVNINAAIAHRFQSDEYRNSNTEATKKLDDIVDRIFDTLKKQNKEEPNDAISIGSSAPLHVDEAPGNSPKVGGRVSGTEKPAVPQTGGETRKEVQSNDQEKITRGPDRYLNLPNEPIKKDSSRIITTHKTEDGNTFALISALNLHGDKIATVRQIDANDKNVVGKYGNGWKTPDKAKEDFEYYINEKKPSDQTAPASIEKAAPTQPEPTETQTAPVNAGKSDTEVEKPYYISFPVKKSGETKYTVEFKKVEGEPLQNVHKLDLFTHKTDKGYGVSEGSTGLSLGEGSTKEEAIDKAWDILKTKSPAEMQELIKSKHENGLKSPRGKIESQSTDTENTEAVIAKATATLGKAKASPGGKAKSAGIVDDIDNALDEIDKELEKLGSPLKKGDKVVYEGRKLTVQNVHKTGVDFKHEESGLIERATVHEKINTDFENGKLKMDNGEPEPEPIPTTLGHRLTIAQEHELERNNKEYRDLVAADEAGTLDEAGRDRMHEIYRQYKKENAVERPVGKKYDGPKRLIEFGKNQPQYTLIGKNSQGEEVFENPDGRRARQKASGVVTEEDTNGPRTEEYNTTDNQPPKDEKKAKREKYADDLKAAKRAFMDTFNKALSGINPETIEKGIKLLSVYAKIGIHDFGEIVRDLYDDLGEKVGEIFDGLKAAYGAFATSAEATDEAIDAMTDLREVRKAKFEDYIPKTEKNDTGSKLSPMAENTSAVDEGKPAGGTTVAKQQQPVEKLPTEKNDRGSKPGSKTEAKRDEPAGSGQPGSGGSTGTGKRGANGGPAEPDNGRTVPENTPKRDIKPEDENHVIEKGDTIVPSGSVAKFNANVDALFLLKKLEAENRNPTVTEKKTLAQFVGWGGLAKYLSTPDRADNQAVEAVLKGKRESMYNNQFQRINLDFTQEGPVDFSKYASMNDLVTDIRKRLSNAGYAITPDALRAPLLKNMISNAEYQDATNSTINAHYTEASVIQHMWDLAKTLGFKGGRVLEPSAGIGHFFGFMPKELRNKTSLTGYELDSITGRMLKKLYPQANITVGGFEAARTPQNSQDLVITNVPFGQKAPYDKNFPELSKFSMHNYFIAKNLKLLKPGGIAMIITSSSTMDNAASGKFRDWVTSPDGGNSYLVGAIRLPNNAFDENAGTQVTTDMMVFQKKGQVVDPALEQPFRYTKFLKTGKDSNGNDVDLNVNEYYIDHPDQMLGDMMTAHEAGSGGLYGSDNATLKAPAGFNISAAINKAKNIFPENIVGNMTEAPVTKYEPITAVNKKEGSLFIKDNKVYRVQDGDGEPVQMDAKQIAITKAYTDLKEGLLNLISLEQSDVNALDNIEAQRKELNKDYDAFIKKHGNINSRGTQFLNDNDIDFPIVASLENIARTIDEKGRIIANITKGEILNKRVNFPRTEPTTATDIRDAINISLNYRTGLDLAYMGRMLGEDADAIKEQLLSNELAFENPDTGILETPEEYLSGFVRDKLKKSEIAAVNDPTYKKNVAELKKVIPEDIPSSLISYSLGSSWIPGHVYEDFVSDLLDGTRIKVKYLDMAGKFLVSKMSGLYSVANTNTYSAGGLTAVDIIEDTLNNKQIVVNDQIPDGNGGKKTVKNVEKTAAAQAMQAQLQEAFENYVRGNEDVQRETEQIYNDVFNGQVLRTWRLPDFEYYPGASHTIKLREHQKKAVSRGLSESTLMAHEVGSGKTYTIITTAMEMRRLGTARKPLIGVQNSTLGDFVADFKKLYPAAKILAPSEKEMQADGRKKLFAKIATGDWDAIILPHSQVTMIPDDPERQKAYIREQIEEMKTTMLSISDSREANKFKTEIKKMEEEITKIDSGSSTKSVAKSIGKKSLTIEAQLQKVLDRKVDNVLNFEQLGIDAMLMDEAHKYKRLGFQTSMQNIKGIDTSKSQRSQSVLLKSRWIQEKTGGKNVNFYTGTPISNTMAEAWTMMKYLRPDILEHMGIEYFDQFAKTFGQVIPSLEQTGGGTFKIQNRFAKFQNLPEFINAFRAATDVVLTDDVKEFQNTDTIPKLKNGKFTQVILPQSPELKKQIQQFKDTLEWFDKLTGNAKRENSHVPLVIYNKAKQASIDLRLLDPSNVDSPESKVNRAVQEAYDRYKASSDKKGVQMIFSDMYQSPEPKNRFLDEDGLIVNPAYGKERFNLFEDIKKKLIAKGVPADQIVIFTEPKYDKAERKKAVFAEANAGKIRFLLGTTERMGVGVNAQQKMIALHHLDAPNRPMDFEQRNGRIIRQGNENKEVDVLTYGVEKTLDSAAFQRLSTKQKFINQIMKGQNLERVTEDPADESQMTFDEMMAHLSDSPYAMQKLMVDNKLQSERMKQQNFNQKIIKTNSSLRWSESQLRQSKAVIADQIKFAELTRKEFPDGNITSLKIHDQPEVTEKFGEAADAYINKLIDKFHDSPTNFAKGGLLLNGIRVDLEVRNYEKFSKDTNLVINTPDLHYTMPEIGLFKNKYGHELNIQSNSGTGLLSSIRAQLDNVLTRPAETQQDILREEKAIEQLKKDAAAKFDDSKMISLQTESDELKQKMIEESKKTKPEDEPPPGGGAQTPGEYIRDQSNIKGALDFLDSMKATGGKTMGLIVPIPPAVWNGAIDVMKNILKATNSTQKAIRVAGKYIVDRGGTEAQAKDFEQSMNEKLAGTKTIQKATAPDTEDIMSEENMVKAAEGLLSKIDSKNLSPNEQDFTLLGLNNLTKKELHRFIEIASVMAVDPQGVLSKDVNDLMDRVANRLNPKSGTIVPPTVPPAPPTPPTGDEGDNEPNRKIPKKEKLPMESIEQLPEQTDSEGKPVAKENYSAMGRFNDIRVRNLEQLKDYGEDIGNMQTLRDVRQFATSKSQASIVMKTATDKIVKLVGQSGWKLLREALVESRLRGLRQRWDNWATQIKKTSDNEIDYLFQDGKSSMTYDILSRLDGYENDPNPANTIFGLVTNEQYDDAREYMSDMFANAANNVAYYDKLSNGKTFDEVVKSGKFVDEKMQEAFKAYKDLMEKPFIEGHASNEGIFSDALGPLDTYYPLTPIGKDKHFIAGSPKYKAPDNLANKFATGQADKYSTELADLSNKIASSIRTNNKAVAIRSLENAGLIIKVSKNDPDTGFMEVNGQLYTADKVQVSEPMLLINSNGVTHIGTRYVMMPKWLHRELKPIFEDTGSLADDFSLFGRFNNIGLKLMLGGPIEAISHSYRLLGGIVNSMPYMQEWAYKNGIVGHVGGLILNNPFVKTFAGIGKILFSDITSDEALSTIQEMAKIGVIPEKTWMKTWSKEFAELTNAKRVPIWDWSPILYGKFSVDLKARVALYRLSKAMNPNATPEQLVTMQNELGNYTVALQGELEKFVKKHGLAPFYSFGGAIYRSGIRSVFGLSHLPMTRPSLKEAFTTKIGAEQMAKLAGYKMAQLLSAGIIGLLGFWALTYHHMTNRWPWEDKHSKLLKVPIPEGMKHNVTAKRMFFDKKSGTWNDMDFSFFNPFVNRGIRATGAAAFYENKMLGGENGQASEAAFIQALNTNISPYTSSPMIQLGVNAVTGDAPYITGIRDKYAGTPGISFYRKTKTMPPGLQVPANLAEGILSMNPIVDAAFSPVTKALKYKYSDEDNDAFTAAKSIFNTIVPHLLTPHGNDEAKATVIEKQRKAINTSMRKESVKH